MKTKLKIQTKTMGKKKPFGPFLFNRSLVQEIKPQPKPSSFLEEIKSEPNATVVSKLENQDVSKGEEIKTYDCSGDGEVFQNENLLSIHLDNKRPVDTSVVDGKICDNEGPNNDINETNGNKITPSDKLFICSQCGKRFFRESGLKLHEKIHKGDHCCTVCDKKFKHLSAWVMHQKIHGNYKPFSCSHCNKKFSGHYNMKVHERIHTGEKPMLYVCFFCCKPFSTSYKLERHERIHTGEKPFKCSHCTMTFNSAGNCKQHEETHNKKKTFKCSECSQRFEASRLLKVHYNVWHLNLKPLICKTCDKIFVNPNFGTNKANFKKHEMIHNGEKPYSCKLCEKKFIQKCNLKRHMKKGHKTEEQNMIEDKNAENDDFGKSFQKTNENRDKIIEIPDKHGQVETKKVTKDWIAKKKKLKVKNQGINESNGNPIIVRVESKERKVLEKEKILKGEETFSCSYCVKIFQTPQGLVIHERSHTGEKPFKCFLCDMKFTGSGALRSHEKSHTDSRPYNCSLCDKKFKFRSKLKRHEKYVHTNERQFNCEECGKRFQSSGCLKRHEMAHTREKPPKIEYCCSVCEKKFTSKTHFERHERSHTGEKPFSCDWCGKRFVNNGNLKQHKKTHAGEKPYACAICEMRFSHSNHLKRHVSNIHERKKHKCSQCDMTFTQADNLQAHVKIKHVNNFSCDKCGEKFRNLMLLKQHDRVHTGSKLYKCEQCEKTFSAASCLKIHSLKHKDTMTETNIQELVKIETPVKCQPVIINFTKKISLTKEI